MLESWTVGRRHFPTIQPSNLLLTFPLMDRHSVTHTLDQLAAVLELKGESAARVRAVQRAARSEILATGRSSALDELREQVPPGLVEMLRIPGLGVAKVRR